MAIKPGMMKYCLTLLLLLIAPATACGPGKGTISVSLNQSFTLKISQSAQIQGENLTIRFIRVTADSRCPQNVTCIRAGEVSSEIIINDGDSSTTLTVTQPGPDAQGVKTTYKSFELTSMVQPYPIAGRQIAPGEYTMTLTVKKL